jgi:hypothetical protein
VKRVALSWAFVVSACSTGCGDPPLVATFTSQVVQHDTCRTVGAQPETCTRDEGVSLLRVTLVEEDDDRVWIHGVPNGSEPDTSILGTRTQDDGFVFLVEEEQVNGETGCVLKTTKQLSLAVDEAATKEQIGADACIALLGREVEVVSTSPECDEIHDPPESIQRVARRRWEKPLDCAE